MNNTNRAAQRPQAILVGVIFVVALIAGAIIFGKENFLWICLGSAVVALAGGVTTNEIRKARARRGRS